MRTILAILFVEVKHKDEKPYYLTHALVDDGTECIGYGRNFKLNDSVEVFLHWGKIKMRLHEKPQTENS